MRTHCVHGHRWTTSNTKWRLHASGYRYRQCRTCGTLAKTRRYACDEAFREAQKARTRAAYFRRMADRDLTSDFTVFAQQEIRA